jgi:hypothetical protein
MLVKDLKAELKNLGLPYNGLKKELEKRLNDFKNPQPTIKTNPKTQQNQTVNVYVNDKRIQGKDDDKNIYVNLTPSLPSGLNPHNTNHLKPNEIIKHPPVVTVKPVFYKPPEKIVSIIDEEKPKIGKLKIGSKHLAKLESLFGSK